MEVVRTALFSAAPILADAVITGEDRVEVGALEWLNAAETARVLDAVPSPEGEVVHSSVLAAHLGAPWRS
ncbi:hypothetical protein AB0F91_21365 [Amycolatopsis sp. NPDC023774]|uniref:hypothetical protein n=1 Tax=Amycolatopsis sp. NPDC023774 TaxID=3155015 RepID=UPI00340043B3